MSLHTPSDDQILSRIHELARDERRKDGYVLLTTAPRAVAAELPAVPPSS